MSCRSAGPRDNEMAHDNEMAQFVLAHDNEMAQFVLALTLQGGCEVIIVKKQHNKAEQKLVHRMAANRGRATCLTNMTFVRIQHLCLTPLSLRVSELHFL